MYGCTAPKVGHKSIEAALACPFCRIAVSLTRRPSGAHTVLKIPVSGRKSEREVLGVDASGYPHCIEGPAVRTVFVSGAVESETHLQHGLVHREDGPAVVRFFESGGVKSEQWMTYGKERREHGPSSIERDADGGPITRQTYYGRGGLRFGVCVVKRNGETGQLEPLGWANRAGHVHREPSRVMHDFVARAASRKFGVAADNEPAIAAITETYLVMGGEAQDFEWRVETPTADALSVILALYPNP